MAPEDVLARTPNVLSRDQQESYFANGYLLIEQAIDGPVLEKLRAATASHQCQPHSFGIRCNLGYRNRAHH